MFDTTTENKTGITNAVYIRENENAKKLASTNEPITYSAVINPETFKYNDSICKNEDAEKGELIAESILSYIGEDPTREGLIETPKRMVKAWKEMFKGYTMDPASVFKTFDTDGYDQMVLLKNISYYSYCEHHMVPFYGVAHIAYIPNKRVIGLSKLARLLEIYTKRMQIQERIGEQITNDLMKYLDPLGAACIMTGTHLCVRMRGVKNQTSEMVTSSLKGVFKDKPEVRAELLSLIKS